MNDKRTLIGLGIAALVALGAAFAIQNAREPSRADADAVISDWLLPELHGHVNEVDRLVLSGGGGEPIATIERGTDGWTVANKGGYPADLGALREFLLHLADAKPVEAKTANRERYAALDVGDPASDKDAKGVLVEIGGLAAPVRLIIGKAAAHGGTYVRRAEEAQAWLASGSLVPKRKASDWLRRDLVDIAADRIAAVTIEHPDTPVVELAKEAEGDRDFQLADVPEGREAAADYTLNAPASLVSGLRLEDVLPAADAPPGEDAIQARLVAFDGLAIDVVAWEEGDAHRARFRASVDEERAARHIEAQQAKARAEFEARDTASAAPAADAMDGPDDRAADAADAATPDDEASADAQSSEPPLAVSDPQADRANRRAALDEEVAGLNARFDGWTFVVPAYKYDAIDKSRDDLLKPSDADAK